MMPGDISLNLNISSDKKENVEAAIQMLKDLATKTPKFAADLRSLYNPFPV